MTPLQFKVTNKAEYDDLMQTIERERPEVRWIRGGEKPTGWDLIPFFNEGVELDICINLHHNNVISWEAGGDSLNWQIGQSLPLSALEELCAVKGNEDGSITISPQLQAKLVIALRGGKE